MTSEEGRPILATAALPEGWDWSTLDSSRPRRATEHIGQSEISYVAIDRLRPGDTPGGAVWKLAKDIPIIIMDTLDGFWVFERIFNKLHAFAGAKEEAKADLVARLGAHLKLLSSLESPQMAPVLRMELEYLKAVLPPSNTPGG